MITVIDAGLQATVQDFGRPHLGHLGVPVAGAADRSSLMRANRLVGNPDEEAAIEVLLGRISLRFDLDGTVALTGAPVSATVDGTVVPFDAAVPVRRGQTLETRLARTGLRTYLAVAGGIDVPPVLGSRSTDTLSGLGPAALSAGSTLPIGSLRREGGQVPVPDRRPVSAASPLTIAAWLGPRDDLFPADAIEALRTAEWRISHETDRIGARLLGPSLAPRNGSSLPTEGLALGSIQVPPAGQPIVHLRNHPPTGGYPVIAVIDDEGVDAIAQARPGTPLRFRLEPAPHL